MAAGCNIGFDENDDLVISDIPDDIMLALEQRARASGHEVEEEMRIVLSKLLANARGPKSPLP